MAYQEHADPVAEMKERERQAEFAYDAMYNVRSHLVKNSYEDALAHFSKAIDAAERAGLKSEIERLTLRREHVVNVYDHQFRGFG